MCGFHCGQWPSCSPAVESSVRELGQFNQGQCTSTSMTGAMGLQMTLLPAGQAAQRPRHTTQHRGVNDSQEEITILEVFINVEFNFSCRM